MGLLDILNGMQNGPRGQTQPGKGGMSPITMAMLALLAYKAYQHLGSGQPNTAPANNPVPPANSGGLGAGLGGLLGGLLGGAAGSATQGGGLGGLLEGGLGSLLGGGAAGSVLSSGLGEVVKQLQQAGHGDAAQSWVGTGANKTISPDDLGKALGDDTVNSLAEQAGLSKVDLLEGLSHQLPQLVDQLTPQGSLPDEHEMSRML
ncbi:MAG: DUF937 domain-containing protein [Rhodopseudomonas sp.]|nr:DUF937 domain-containing protein [Rhodopseudomonas sp.]